MRNDWSLRVPKALVLGCAVAAPAAAQQTPASQPSLSQQIAALHWRNGPTSMPIAGNSTFNLPAGYGILAPPDSLKFLQLNGNPTEPDEQIYIFAPEQQNENWFAAISYEDAGHIADSEKIDPDQILQNAKNSSVQENQARQQQGMGTLTLTGWASLPVYDTQTHRLEWAFDYVDASGLKSEDFNTRILSRTGDAHVILVDDPSVLQSDIPAFNVALQGFSFDPGQRYSDYQQGDKLAQYGIAGLIAGGAAAVAVKTGLFAGLIGLLVASSKALFAGVVAIIAVASRRMKRFFGRK